MNDSLLTTTLARARRDARLRLLLWVWFALATLAAIGLAVRSLSTTSVAAPVALPATLGLVVSAAAVAFALRHTVRRIGAFTRRGDDLTTHTTLLLADLEARQHESRRLLTLGLVVLPTLLAIAALALVRQGSMRPTDALSLLSLVVVSMVAIAGVHGWRLTVTLPRERQQVEGIVQGLRDDG
jgi:hypothetical protein